MPKIERGRLTSIDAMLTYTASELFVWADELEGQIDSPSNQDDPRYLRRWAGKLRRLAVKKEKAKTHKQNQR